MASYCISSSKRATAGSDDFKHPTLQARKLGVCTAEQEGGLVGSEVTEKPLSKPSLDLVELFVLLRQSR